MTKNYIKKVLGTSLAFVSSAGIAMLIYHFSYFSNTNKNVSKSTLTSNESYDLLRCKYFDIVGDGYCDDEANTANCDFDEGDCCHPDHDRSICTECFCMSPKIVQNCDEYIYHCKMHEWHVDQGDGVCNEQLNSPECYFDGGDCCLEDCTDCNCISSNLTCIESELGDGICQDYNNFICYF